MVLLGHRSQHRNLILNQLLLRLPLLPSQLLPLMPKHLNLNIPNNCHPLNSNSNSNTLHNRPNFLHNPMQQLQVLLNPRLNHSLLHNPLFHHPFPIPTSSNNLRQVDGTAQVPIQRANNINRLFTPNHSNINSFLASNKTTACLYINNG